MIYDAEINNLEKNKKDKIKKNDNELESLNLVKSK